MGTWRAIVHRVRYLGRRARFDRQLDDEIRFHVESRADELERTGVARSVARDRALREFGPTARIKEDTRSAWQFRWFEDLVADLRFAIRSFRLRPAFSATATTCLAIGIGANALIFSLVNAVLLRSLPYPEADRIVMVRFTPPNQPDQKLGTNAGSYFFVREHSRSFERMGAIRITGFSVAAESPGEPVREWVQGGWVSPGLTDVMGVPPLIGRWFSMNDRDFNVVISYGLWQRLFAASPDVLGKKLLLEGSQAPTIIGVAPQGFQTLNPDLDLWRLQPDENLAGAARSPNRVFTVFGRLKPGVTLEQAQADLNTLAAPLGDEMDMNRGWAIKADSLREAYLGYLRQPLLVLQGAVLLVLLVACANVAGLVLAQASARQKELAVRAALGSSRGRVVRQLLAENIVLFVGGGVLGIVLAGLSLRMMLTTGLSAFPDLQDVSLDRMVVGATLLLSLGMGLVFGVLPAFQISRPDVMEVVRETTRTVTAGAARSRLRGAFVVAQVGLAFVLVVGAGLLVRSLVRLNSVHPGLDSRQVVTLQIPFPRGLYRTTLQNTPSGGYMVEFDSRFSRLSERVREQLTRVPGVVSATAAVTPPLGGQPRRIFFSADGQIAATREREGQSAEWYPVSAGYVETLKIPILRGRAIGLEDTDTTRPVAMINETMARRYWPNDDPVGKILHMDVLQDPPREIVGVIGDVGQDRFQTGPQPQMYVPRTQLPRRMDMTMSLEVLVTTFIVRTASGPTAVVPSLRAAIREVDPTLPVSSVRTVDEYAAGQLRELNQYAFLLGLFGAISVTLSVVGILGVMAHAVSQRTNEIGIRLALGAQSANVLHLVLRQGLALISAGLTIGLVASFIVMPVIRSFLWGITVTDPLTFALSVLGVAAVALLACYLPARRVLSVAPIVALRSE